MMFFCHLASLTETQVTNGFPSRVHNAITWNKLLIALISIPALITVLLAVWLSFDSPNYYQIALKKKTRARMRTEVGLELNRK